MVSNRQVDPSIDTSMKRGAQESPAKPGPTPKGERRSIFIQREVLAKLTQLAVDTHETNFSRIVTDLIIKGLKQSAMTLSIPATQSEKEESHALTRELILHADQELIIVGRTLGGIVNEFSSLEDAIRRRVALTFIVTNPNASPGTVLYELLRMTYGSEADIQTQDTDVDGLLESIRDAISTLGRLETKRKEDKIRSTPVTYLLCNDLPDRGFVMARRRAGGSRLKVSIYANSLHDEHPYLDMYEDTGAFKIYDPYVSHLRKNSVTWTPS